MCFKTYLRHPINKKTSQKNYLRRSQFSKKRGGGPARYDHDHRFNGFFYPFPKGNVINKDHQRMMVDPMFKIVQSLRSFLTAVTTTAVAPIAVIYQYISEIT